MSCVNYRYIEIIKVFEIFGIIAGIKRIYATYPILGFVVKPKALIIRLQSNKKGEFMCLDSPFWVWIPSRYPKWISREFRSNHGGIWWLRRPLKNRISQIFGSFEKL
jgi:hypothetical protein